MPTFWMFSMTRRRLAATSGQLVSMEIVLHHTGSRIVFDNIPSTITMRFLKPMKLGVSVVSWLRQDGFDLEWTASTWRYLLRNALRNSEMPTVSSAVPFAVPFVEPLVRRSDGVVVS